MVVNLRTCGISRVTYKLIRTPTVIKEEEEEEYLLCNVLQLNIH
jgi:hypothetical protein